MATTFRFLQKNKEYRKLIRVRRVLRITVPFNHGRANVSFDVLSDLDEFEINAIIEKFITWPDEPLSVRNIYNTLCTYFIDVTASGQFL